MKALVGQGVGDRPRRAIIPTLDEVGALEHTDHVSLFAESLTMTVAPGPAT